MKQASAKTPARGSKAFWNNQTRHVNDFFVRVSKDDEMGGFFTHIGPEGDVTNRDEKFLMPTSRQVFTYSKAYEMTGDRFY